SIFAVVRENCEAIMLNQGSADFVPSAQWIRAGEGDLRPAGLQTAGQSSRLRGKMERAADDEASERLFLTQLLFVSGQRRHSPFRPANERLTPLSQRRVRMVPSVI